MFILTEVRATNLAASTIDSVTRAFMVAHQVSDHKKIDLGARFAEGKVLELHEIDGLAQLTGLTQPVLEALMSATPTTLRSRRVVSLEKVRMGLTSHAPPPQVKSTTKGTCGKKIWNAPCAPSALSEGAPG